MRNDSRLYYQTGQRRPVLDRAQGVYLWDVSGKRYLDGSSGAMVSNIGHSNPRVLAAMQDQMGKSTFGYRLHFETDPAEDLAEALAARAPDGMERVFFVSGGSEAVESAIKLARQYAVKTGGAQRWKVISRHPSYHGSTLGALSLSSSSPLTANYDAMMRPMPKIPAPRAYLDGLDASLESTGHHYATMLEDRILAEGPETVLAFIHEPVGGATTGALVPPVGYMQRIREICDKYEVLLIHDEVMSGVGRTGRFFAAEHWGVAPDIVTLSKGIGGGYVPLGAMIAHEKIIGPVMEAGGFNHGFTYAGNPLACAAGLAIVKEIEQEGLIENAAKMGLTLKAALNGLMARYPFIGDVRGLGLLTAVELVSDRETLTPLPREMNAQARLIEIAYDNELIMYGRRTRGGHEGDHVMVCPPMIVTEDQIGELIELLTRSLDQLAAETGLPVSN